MDTDSQRIEVVVARRVTEPVWWASLSKPLEAIVSALPTYRDTASGRRNANQVRLVMLATGVLIVVLWRSPWAPAALILCLSALVLPVSESRRRQLTASIRVKRQRGVVKREPGLLELNEKHLLLVSGDETLRKFRRKVLKREATDDTLILSVGGKKRERLLVTGADAIPAEDLWVETDLVTIEKALGP